MMNHYKTLAGKNCLITGATGGIGGAIANELATHQCNLLLTGRSLPKLAAVKCELSSYSKINICTVAADLTDLHDMQKVIEVAEHKLKHVDILINCVGNFLVKPLTQSSLNDFDTTFNLIVRIPFLLVKAFAPIMQQNRWGRIVNIGSSSAYTGYKNTALYCAAKHALLGFSRVLHNELKEYNVRTFCISPSGTKTAMGKMIPNQNYDTFIEPEEIAKYVSFVIASDGMMVSEEIRLNRLIIDQ